MTVTKVDVAVARDLDATAKKYIAAAIEHIIDAKLGVHHTVDFAKEFTQPKAEHGDVAYGCFGLMPVLKGIAPKFLELTGTPLNPKSIGPFLQQSLQQLVDEHNAIVTLTNGAPLIQNLNIAGPYLNIRLTPSFHGQMLTSVIFGDYLHATPDPKKDHVMIEYSQPNTHKAFHVGHMRNAALGDCLRRLYEQCGYRVTPVNYFGDEGAHVAKCLWYLQEVYLPKAQLAFQQGLQHNPEDPTSIYPIQDMEHLDEAIPVADRAEFLGEMYTEAVNLLDLSLYTSCPWPQVVAAKVLTKQRHPDSTAPHNWNVVTVDYGVATPATVVCGGVGYQVGDIVAYLPVGNKLNKQTGIVAPKDMKGVESHGFMLAYTEIGETIELSDEQVATFKAELTPPPAPAPVVAAATPEDAPAAAAAADKKKGGNNKKAPKQQELTPAVIATKVIKVLPNDSVVGQNLAELGKNTTAVPADQTVMEFFNALKKRAADVLLKLEDKDVVAVNLWKHTGKWSLDEFHRIYDWLGCRFDHDFTESEVSEPSREIVSEMLEQGILTHKDGAVVADLNEFNLGYCVLLKSDGAGLYATKDLALAKRKFKQYNVDKSIYVVDSAQSYHFSQVFKVLQLAGYPQAQKCLHLPYGIVTLPSGRMSSRKGNVMLFSQLRSTLSSVLQEKYGKNAPLSDEAIRRIAVAAIRYGMLNHDTAKDIVFDLEKWTNNTGNTGPYLLYAFSRITSILTIRDIAPQHKFDLATFLRQKEIIYQDFIHTDDITGVVTIQWERFLTSSQGEKFLALVDYDKYLTEPSESTAMLKMHRFWPMVHSACENNNPSPLCDYVFSLAQSFSSWYENVRLVDVPQEAIATKIVFLLSISNFIHTLCQILGFDTIDRM